MASSPATAASPTMVTVAMRMPAMIVGRASGSSMRRSRRVREKPMPSAASLISSGTDAEAGDDVPQEDEQRVARQRDQGGGAGQPGVGDEEGEGGQRRDREEHPGDRQRRAIEPRPACGRHAERQRDQQPEADGAHGEDRRAPAVSERDEVGVATDPVPPQPAVDVAGQHSGRGYRARPSDAHRPPTGRRPPVRTTRGNVTPHDPARARHQAVRTGRWRSTTCRSRSPTASCACWSDRRVAARPPPCG